MIVQLSQWLAVLLVLVWASGCDSPSRNEPDAGLDAAQDAGGEDGDDDPGDAGDPGDGGDGEPGDGDQGPLDCSQHLFEDVMIPMRDGQALAAFVRRAADPRCALPTILIQTPYDKENARGMWFVDSPNEPLFDSLDYAFCVVDWRGFFGSRDAAVAGPQPHGPDGHDLVEWIAEQPWSDGRVGTWGVSALCTQQYKTAIEQPPHLAAMVPIFCQANLTYDQYYPGGVLRQEYYDFISAYYGGDDIILQHPYRDGLWSTVERLVDLSQVAVPCLVVAGWYDLFPSGGLRDFATLQTSSPQAVRQQHRLLVGPWIHFAVGGETRGVGRELDEQELTFVDLERRIQIDSLAFFDHHLRGQPSGAADWSPARWQTGGDRVWEQAPQWPPASHAQVVFYPAPGGGLELAAPDLAYHGYGYDPDDPSPTIGGGTLLPNLDHGPRAQDEVVDRADALVFASSPLSDPLRLHGAVEVSLRVATTGADTDFSVRLTDVGPDGSHLLVGEGIQRLKLRDDLGVPDPAEPGPPNTIRVPLTAELAYTFSAGHRVGLIVSSSNYPRFARNPNTGQDFYADEPTPAFVTNTLVLGLDTHLTLPLGP